MVGLQRSTYYDIKHHQPTNQEIRRVLLADAIADIHARSRGTYGMLRVRAALEIERGIIVNKKLVWKIMRQLGIRGLPGPKKWKPNLVNAATEEDLVKRNFMATGPNELWLTDITEHPTREGKVYCCAVLDLFSRKIVGWAIDRRCESVLVNDALVMAAESRTTSRKTVIHSDHGTQFTSWAFTENIRRYGLMGSMGTVGDCYDKAMVSYCTPCRWWGGRSFVEADSLPFEVAGVAGGGWVEESDVLVVGLVGDHQAGTVPGLDGGWVHADAVGEFGDGEQSLGSESFEVTWQAVAAA